MIFLFFGSSLAHLEPKLQLFEVWKIIMMICHTIIWDTAKSRVNFLTLLEQFDVFFCHMLLTRVPPDMCRFAGVQK